MEKRIWSKPEMHEFAFAANEYVASACGGGTTYKFKCDAGLVEKENPLYPLPGQEPTYWAPTYGDLTDSKGNLYTPDNYGLTSRYHACGETHEASVEDEFVLGRFYENGGNDNLSGPWTEVYIWIEKISGIFGSRKDYHATTNLDKDHWETNKS